MNRRRALVTLGLTAFGGVAWSLTKPRLLWAKLADANQAVEDRLRQDLARRSQRINSEEGIAMFLVCEDLVPHDADNVALTPMNTALAAELHRNAEAWLRIHPDAQYNDVAQIVEVLAYRDFTNGATAEGQ